MCNQKFIGIKRVCAVDMTASVARSKGYRVNGDETRDGVEVTYEDGYKSWCPLDVFQRSNYPIFNETLADSMSLMMSADYKDRFKAEVMQLQNRYEGLKKMVEKWDKGDLSFTPTCPREIYNFQLKAMKEYLDTLIIRAKIEGVEL